MASERDKEMEDRRLTSPLARAAYRSLTVNRQSLFHFPYYSLPIGTVPLGQVR